MVDYAMTWGNPPPFKPDPPKQGKIITPAQLAASGSEHSHQSALFAWAALNVGKYPQLKYMFAIPNGGLRDVRTAANLKAEGVKAGVPDIFLPWANTNEHSPSEGYHGLFLELKIKTGRVSKDQKEYIDFLNSQGYKCIVCWSWLEAKEEIEKYLNAA